MDIISLKKDAHDNLQIGLIICDVFILIYFQEIML